MPFGDDIELNLPQVQGRENPSGSGEPTRSKADLLKRYRDRISTSKKWREAEQYDQTWRRLIDFYRGKQFDHASKADQISVNLSFATVNTIWPSVSINYPKIQLTAKHQESEAQATIAGAVINYWWRHYQFQEQVSDAVKDGIIVGHGWVKTCWRYEEKEREYTPEEFQEQLMAAEQQVSSAAAQAPERADQLPSTEDLIKSIQAQRITEVVQDRPTVERLSPFDIYVDPESTDILDAKWIAQKLVIPLETAQADPRYKSAARKALKANAALNPRWRDTEGERRRSSGEYSDDIKRVILYEFYNLLDQTWCVFPETGDSGFLIDPEPFKYPFKHPFVVYENYEVPDQFYALGDLEMLEPLQRELNAVRTSQMNDRKRFVPKHIARRGGLADDAIAALESDVPNTVIFVEDEVNDLINGVIVPLRQDTIVAEMYGYSDQIIGDIERVSGLTEYQRGEVPETRRTATEAAILQDASNARVSDKLAGVEKFIRQIAENLVQLAQQYMTGEQVARISGHGDEQMWVPFDREDIEGEFDFDVEAGSTQPQNEAVKRQTALQLLNTMSPYLGTVIRPDTFIAHVLQEGFGIRNPMQYMIPQLAPQGAPGEEGAGAGEGGQGPPTTGAPGPNTDPQALLAAQQQA